MEKRAREITALVVGMGEVGRALAEILQTQYTVLTKDVEEMAYTPVDVMHICFPYAIRFLGEVSSLIAKFSPRITIIHSTVPLGTTDHLLSSSYPVVFSPVRGRHPDMARDLLRYEKVIASEDREALRIARLHLQRAGFRVKEFSNAKSAEAAKLLCTTYYGWNIVFAKSALQWCRLHNVNFDEAYKDFTRSYNEHVDPAFRKPIIDPIAGKIGGHCVIPNAELMQWDIADFILMKNRTYGTDTV